MTDEPLRSDLLSPGPDDGDWTDVVKRARKAHRHQVYAAVALTALIVAGAASAYALVHRGQPWCKTPTSEAWKKALASHVVELSRHAGVVPLAVADDGHSFYAELVSKGYSGIVRIDARTSRYVKIQHISRPNMFGAVGSADGRWFVWVDMWRDFPNDPDYPIWQIWSWDSRTHRIRRLADEPNAGLHADWLSVSSFSVRDGYAVWAQSAPDGGGELYAFDLEGGRDRVVYRGGVDTDPLLLPGRVVVWGQPIWTSSGKNVELTAVNADTGETVTLPPAIRGLRGNSAAMLSTGGGAVVYAKEQPGDSLWGASALWWSPSLSTKPWPVFRFEHGIASAQVAGRYVLLRTSVVDRFGKETATDNIVDAISGSYVKISSNPGAILLNGKALVMKQSLHLKVPDAVKLAHPITDVTFLPVKSFPPIRSCPEPATVTR